MPGPVLVGVDGSGDEAPELGRMLAELIGAPLALVAVYGYESSSPDRPPREQAEARLEHARLAGARRPANDPGGRRRRA